MGEKLYCMCNTCPFRDCDKHASRLRGMEKGQYVRVANLGGTCRRYLDHLLDEVKKGGDGE